MSLLVFFKFSIRTSIVVLLMGCIQLGQISFKGNKPTKLVKKTDVLDKNKTVGLYWPMQGEVDIMKLAVKFPSKAALPKIKGALLWKKTPMQTFLDSTFQDRSYKFIICYNRFVFFILSTKQLLS